MLSISDCALFQRQEGAVRPKRHLAKIIIVADTGEDEVGIARGRRRCVRGSAAEFGDPSVGALARAIEHDDVVVSAHLEMAGHGIAHDAEPDPGDFAHCLAL